MSNSAKLYLHPSISGAFILETNQGNYELTNSGVKKTTVNGQGDPQPWDISVQMVIDNARTASVNQLSTDAINALMALVDEKTEDFDQ